MDAPTCKDCHSSENRFSQGPDVIDPRVQIELEKLNRASDEINCLELQLQGGRATFRQLLTETTRTLNDLGQKLGKCVDKARPYYEARIKAREVQMQAQTAVLRYERSCSMLAAAKEMVHLAEQGYVSQGQPFDPAWQEMLNHATGKVNEAEIEKVVSEKEHEAWAKAFAESDRLVKKLQKEFKRSIIKSRPYFEAKAKANQLLQEQKAYIEDVERGLMKAKQIYKDTLGELEMISEEIHQRRMLGRENTDPLNCCRLKDDREELSSALHSGELPPQSCVSAVRIIDSHETSHTLSNTLVDGRASNDNAVPSEMSTLPSQMMESGTASQPVCGKTDTGSLDRGYLSDASATVPVMEQSNNTEGALQVQRRRSDADDSRCELSACSSQRATTPVRGQLSSVPVLCHPLSESQNVLVIQSASLEVIAPASQIPQSPSNSSVGNATLGSLSLPATSSPGASPSILIFPSSSSSVVDVAENLSSDVADSQTIETNAAVMASIQKLKGFAKSLLRGRPSSRTSDAASEASCDSAMASISMIGDEIIDNLTIEPEDYALFLAAATAADQQQYAETTNRMDSSFYAN